jgi:hypothetical protein
VSVKSKLTKLVVFGAIAGGVAAAVKKMKGGEQDNWQSSYTPPPAPESPRPAAPEPEAATPPAPPEAVEAVEGVEEPAPQPEKKPDPLTDPLPPEQKP